MKAGLLIISFAVLFSFQLTAQKKCSTSLSKNESTLNTTSNRGEGIEETIIKIPVVVHILYHYPYEKISDAEVYSQIEALNKCFRRKGADTVNTPFYFRAIATDCKIEFQLAVSDPEKRNTNGIVKKYTPVIEWQADDKMKSSAEMGDDPWDPQSYLNIWVCSLDRVAGYASVPGGAWAKDGIVIGFDAFGTINSFPGYEMGKTAVHEIGHWLNLNHLWGDVYCGDDGVSDTPKQTGYNVECPTGINISCGNGPYGDMYMNYMDFTNDQCMNLFTQGQKARMRSVFASGGWRQSILSSTGLNPPLIWQSPIPEADPSWLHPQLYPNPAHSKMSLDLSYDPRWIGKKIIVYNLQGQLIKNVTVTSKIQSIDISHLQPGVYLLAAKRDENESMMLKFVKL